MSIHKSKKGFEMSFSMIFSLLAGGAILFLAIYATVKLVNQGQETTYIEAAKSIDNYLGDLVTGIADGASTKISFRKETRIMFDCDYPDVNSPFGKQSIRFSEESGIGEKWYNSTNKVTRKNKYIFADDTEQGRKMFIFIKPFYMGFKVDDLIIMSANNYCFVSDGMPPRIIEDLENLQMGNVKIEDTCSSGNGNITVCFGSGSGCDVIVQNTPSSDCPGGCDAYEVGTVQKDADPPVKYVGNLLYGAIFSSKNIYECNVARLGKKTATLAELYYGKINVVPSECISPDSEVGGDLLTLMGEGDITNKYATAKDMDNANAGATCKIYPGESYGNV